MAVTQLTDAIVPEVFFPYMLKETARLSQIFQSGILRQDANMAAKLAGGGTTFNVPFWNDLARVQANIASDNPATVAVPQKIGAGKDMAIRQIRTQGWSTADLVSELAGSDPMQAIASRVSKYWVDEFQSVLVNTLSGVFADNVANDASDMLLDIGTDAVGTPTAAELVSAEAILDAAQTMGDASDKLSVLIMHSRVYTRLAKQNLIDFIPDSEGRVRFPTYLGYRVVKDDGVRAVVGTNRTKYWTYLAGEGAIGWAESAVDTPVETDRFPAQGNGMGVEQLWTRRQYAMHPYGIAFTNASTVGEFPTDAELAAATNWNRVYPERKQISIAALVTNG
jgi:hypothetical protein